MRISALNGDEYFKEPRIPTRKRGYIKLLLLLLFMTFMQSIYSYKRETNHVSRVSNVAAIQL
jgi:hypothetical protein